ncbi:hypothetical protein PMAYCL1PPCAC_31516, partial [Pristionchus mayeri]
TMRQWPKKTLPSWFFSTVKRRSLSMDGKEGGIVDPKKMKMEIEESENECILEEGEKAEVIDEHVEEGKREGKKGEMDGMSIIAPPLRRSSRLFAASPRTSRASSLDRKRMTDVMLNEGVNERKEKSGERNVSTTVETKLEGNATIIPDVENEKRIVEVAERIGLAALSDTSVLRRVMRSLTKMVWKDIRAAEETIHSSIFKQIQQVLSERIDRDERATMVVNLHPILPSRARWVLYQSAALLPPSSLPLPLVRCEGRQAHLVALNVIIIIQAYTMRSRLPDRQLIKTIVEAYVKGGVEKVLEELKGVLEKDVLLLKILSDYLPTIPAKKSEVWESIDLRKAEHTFNIFQDNQQIVLEGAEGDLTNQMSVETEKPSANNDGEPLRRSARGKGGNERTTSVQKEKNLKVTQARGKKKVARSPSSSH